MIIMNLLSEGKDKQQLDDYADFLKQDETGYQLKRQEGWFSVQYMKFKTKTSNI